MAIEESKNAVQALLKAQKVFEGVAEELGIHDEQDIVDMVNEIRAERSEQDQFE